MPSNTVCRGNILYNFIVGVTLTPVAVAQNTSAEQNFTVVGLQTTDFVQVASQVAQTAGIGVNNARCSAANTLTVSFNNITGGSLTPVSGAYSLEINRPENNPLPSNAT